MSSTQLETSPKSSSDVVLVGLVDFEVELPRAAVDGTDSTSTHSLGSSDCRGQRRTIACTRSSYQYLLPWSEGVTSSAKP